MKILSSPREFARFDAPLVASTLAGQRRPTVWPTNLAPAPTFATTGPGGASPITSSEFLPFSTDKIRKIGCVPRTLNALGTDYITNVAAGVGGGGAMPWSIEFEFFGDDLAIKFRCASAGNSNFWLSINDPASGAALFTDASPVFSTAAAANSSHWFRITFPTVAQRCIRLQIAGADFGGISKKIIHTVSLTSAIKSRKLCVIGDSYCSGALSIPPSFTWPSSLARLLGAELFLNAVGGTGFSAVNVAAGGNNAFSAAPRIQAAIDSGADDFLITGGINDQSISTAVVESAATDLILAIKSNLPAARIWMTSLQGLPLGVTTAGNNAATNVALSKLAEKYNIMMVDMWSSLFTGSGRNGSTVGDGNRDLFLGTDAVHPTQAGHDYIATMMYHGMIAQGW